MTSEIPSPAASASPGHRATRPARPWRQLFRFAVVGVASTAAYALLFLLLRMFLGAFAANALALLLTAIANTAANRRLTFGVRGNSGVFGDHAAGLLAFGAGLLLTTGALAALHALTDPGRVLELVVLMLANAVATLLRFVVLRTRLNSSASPTPPAPTPPSVAPSPAASSPAGPTAESPTDSSPTDPAITTLR